MPKKIKIFISYSSKDFALVDKYKEELSKNNFDIWMAPDSIPLGGNYASSIPEGIKSCDIFIVFISNNSLASQWVEQEVLDAVNSKSKKIIIPIYIEDVILNGKFKFVLDNKQAITYNSNSLNPGKNIIRIVAQFKTKLNHKITLVDELNEKVKNDFFNLNNIFTSLNLSYSPNSNLDTFNLDLIMSSFDKNNQELNADNLQHTKNKYLVYGCAGSGKSTTIKKLLYEVAVLNSSLDNQSIPIYFNLANLNDSSSLTLKYLAEHLSKNNGMKNLDESQIEEQMRCRHLILAFDGLDEYSIESVDKQNQLLLAIDNLCNQVDCSLIIGCRSDSSKKFDLSKYICVEVQPLTHNQAIDFVDNYFTHFGINLSAKQFYENLPNEFADSLKTPLLLSILVALYLKTKIIPKNINDLYKIYIERLIKKISTEKRPIDMAKMFLLYCKIAFEMLIKGKTVISVVELNKIPLFEKPALKTGLLVDNNGSIGFLHASFMEYLAGLECKQEYGFIPKECMDQYFLKNEDIIKRIIRVIDINDKDCIIEVGAGIGSVASYYPTCKKLYLVDLDEGLCKILRYNFRNQVNTEVLQDDAIKLLKTLSYNKVVSNLPFFLTKSVLDVLKDKQFDVAVMSVKYEETFANYEKYFSIIELMTVDGSCFYPEQPFKSKLIMIKKK